MKKIILILSILPLAANSQTLIPDTIYYGTAPNYIKVPVFRNAATTSFIPKSDTVALAVTKWKLDSTAAALAASTAATYYTIAAAAGKLNTNGNGSSLTGITAAQVGAQPTITVLPFANGGISASAATSATTGTMTVNMTSSVITITPTGACTFNASGGVAGQLVTFSITTSGTTSFIITFGTNFRKTGTLATGTVSARFFTVTFRCINGTIWSEVSRTIAQT